MDDDVANILIYRLTVVFGENYRDEAALNHFHPTAVKSSACHVSRCHVSHVYNYSIQSPVEAGDILSGCME